MGAVVVVADRTVDTGTFVTSVKDRLAAGKTAVHLVIPLRAGKGDAMTEGLDQEMIHEVPHATKVAIQRLDSGLARLAEVGADATGEVAGPDVIETVRAAVGRIDADEVVVCTLNSTVSRWLRQDLPTKIGRKVDVPVSVASEPGS